MRRASYFLSLALMVPASAFPLSFGSATAPDWMHAQQSLPVPDHDPKAEAVILYQESNITVSSNGKVKRLDRRVLKLLRPDSRTWAWPRFYFSNLSPITSLHGWSIPPNGKDFEMRDRDIIEASVDLDGGELMSDSRMKLMQIPGAEVGTLVGYEVERELSPFELAINWDAQETVPIREEKFSVILPPGWTYESTWLNHADQAAVSTGPNRWSWTLSNVPAVKIEKYMPPWEGIAQDLVVSVKPPGDKKSIQSWNDIGAWYAQLTQDRRASTPAIKQKVAELTANQATMLDKMRALAKFVQTDIRYVAIELGIGGHQPHSAADIFNHRYGDCKDNVTVLGAMLNEIGVSSYYVLINTDRGTVSQATPPNLLFNHAIMAIALPDSVSGLPAQLTDAKLGKILFFDPTDNLTPFGSLPGELQSNYGLLVANGGGELVKLPQLPPEMSGIVRTAKLELDDKGTLRGDIREVHSGGSGAVQRAMMRSAERDTDKVRPVERVAGASLSNFQVLKASVLNLRAEDHPFQWDYTLEALNYAKPAGDLVLIRPRVLGSQSEGFLETKEPRVHAIEFLEPERNSDVIEISLPAGYAVDELPPAVNIDDGFAAYHSKTEFSGHTLKYTRTLEIRELSVPAAKAETLKQFYREIAADERSSAVLKRPPGG
jgi:hypothetical protein